jgi:hypothetical protein
MQNSYDPIKTTQTEEKEKDHSVFTTQTGPELPDILKHYLLSSSPFLLTANFIGHATAGAHSQHTIPTKQPSSAGRTSVGNSSSRRSLAPVERTG